MKPKYLLISSMFLFNFPILFTLLFVVIGVVLSTGSWEVLLVLIRDRVPTSPSQNRQRTQNQSTRQDSRTKLTRHDHVQLHDHNQLGLVALHCVLLENQLYMSGSSQFWQARFKEFYSTGHC